MFFFSHLLIDCRQLSDCTAHCPMRLLSPQSVLRCVNNVGSTWCRNSSGTALTPALQQLRKARRVARLVLGGAQPKPGDLVQERSCETLIEIVRTPPPALPTLMLHGGLQYPQMPLSERNSFIHMLSQSYKAVPETIQASIAEWQVRSTSGSSVVTHLLTAGV